jgi:beta-galactosidase
VPFCGHFLPDPGHDGFLEWQVPYQPGGLLAKGYSDGKPVATDQLETTGEPTSLQLSPDR